MLKSKIIKRESRTVDEGEMGFHDYVTYKEDLQVFADRVLDIANKLDPANIQSSIQFLEDAAIIIYEDGKKKEYCKDDLLNKMVESGYTNPSCEVLLKHFDNLYHWKKAEYDVDNNKFSTNNGNNTDNFYIADCQIEGIRYEDMVWQTRMSQEEIDNVLKEG